MAVLNSTHRKQLLSLLENLPEMREMRSRQQLLNDAGLSHMAKRIDLSGAIATAAREIVDALGDRDLAAFLLVVRELVGAENQEFLDRLRSHLSTPSADTNGEDIDALVREVRQKLEPDIRQRCGTMQVLDMTQPIGLGQIYTDVNILEAITARQRTGLTELQEICSLDAFDRLKFGQVERERVPGIDAANAHAKLMIWGKPGAGKTTFLRYLAMQCLDGTFQGDRIPLFVTLKNFAEAEKKPRLSGYIGKHLADWGITPHITKALFHAKRVLLLLDGLDEVRQEDSRRVIDEIQRFANRHHGNHFAITCRIAAKEYTFQGFTEVEVADFDDEQIQSFVGNWFAAKKDSQKTERFLSRLKENQPIRELATSPLLLTLLCLVFGATNDFPSNRWELYKEGIDVLLKKWDANRNIERDRVYRQLSVNRKEFLLAQIASTTFDRGEYFFKQRHVERYIGEFIRNLKGAKDDPEALQLDSEAVLKSIEAQHGLLVERAKGIYSFSHLTFQEYFTASHIAEKGEKALRELARHITEPRWREVFFLVMERLNDASDFAVWMKAEIDGLVADDQRIQEYLTWFRHKFGNDKTVWTEEARQVFAKNHGYSFVSDRGYSHTLTLDFTFDLPPYLDLTLDLSLDLSLAFDLSLSLVFELSPDFPSGIDLDIYQILSTRSISLAEKEDPELYQALKQLQEQLPDQEDEEAIQAWWKQNGKVWMQELCAAMIQHRDIDRDWQFSEEQEKLLRTYWNAYKLLFQCLNTECSIDRDTRLHIEETLFIPVGRGWRSQ